MFNNYIQFTNLPLSKKTDALQQKLQHIINATYTQIFPHEIKNQLDAWFLENRWKNSWQRE